MEEKLIEDLINEIHESINKTTSEIKNALNACRENSLLSCGNRAMDFRNAAFIISGKCNPKLIIKLNKIGEKFASVNSNKD